MLAQLAQFANTRFCLQSPAPQCIRHCYSTVHSAGAGIEAPDGRSTQRGERSRFGQMKFAEQIHFAYF
jgi:hypothetical protein